MSVVKLKPGEVVIVSAGDPNRPDHSLPPPQPGTKPPTGPVDPGYGIPEKPVDPGYGIDLGLGWLRPTHPIVLPPSGEHPDNTLPLPPEGPVDP
jgi:hypothetical protein